MLWTPMSPFSKKILNNYYWKQLEVKIFFYFSKILKEPLEKRLSDIPTYVLSIQSIWTQKYLD